MGSHKKKGYSTPEAVSAPGPDYNVTGVLTPDSTCNYFLAGTYGGKNYYQRTDSNYFIWYYEPSGCGYISAELGNPSTPHWYRNWIPIRDLPPEGAWAPENGASGTAYVSAGGH